MDYRKRYKHIFNAPKSGWLINNLPADLVLGIPGSRKETPTQLMERGMVGVYEVKEK